ncbi:hypothetical protein ABIA32_006368 [Streptacidiphilus sp. MAP12-20]|uniref:condensation domain-containing protein n=1 Tax=Streptacidiphilus sp. MAP12-20 TaxID=3156299 RepID=UPI0035146EE1
MTLPLSYAQQRLWFLHRLEGPSPTYNLPALLHLTGPLDRGALLEAFGDMVRRHEILRTVYRRSPQGPVQVVLDPDQALARILAAVRESEEDVAALRAAAGYCFDLADEPPLRISLSRTGPDRHTLLMLFHHIGLDGWSLGPFARDLAKAYRARRAGRTPDLEELEIQYADYALWQQELLGAEQDPQSISGQQLAYWTQQLAGIPQELALPYDRPRPAGALGAGRTVEIDIDADTHLALSKLADDQGASLTMAAIALIATLFTRLGAGSDIPLGTVVSGRCDEGLDDLVGFFVNTLALRVDTSGDPGFARLLSLVRETCLAGYDRQDLPFDRVVRALKPARVPGRQPVFQTMVSLQSQDATGFELDGLHIEAEELRPDIAQFDLSVVFREKLDREGTPLGLGGFVEYSTDLFDRATMQRLTAQLADLARAVCAAPQLPISQLDPARTAHDEHPVPARRWILG